MHSEGGDMHIKSSLLGFLLEPKRTQDRDIERTKDKRGSKGESNRKREKWRDLTLTLRIIQRAFLSRSHDVWPVSACFFLVSLAVSRPETPLHPAAAQYRLSGTRSQAPALANSQPETETLQLQTNRQTRRMMQQWQWFLVTILGIYVVKCRRWVFKAAS